MGSSCLAILTTSHFKSQELIKCHPPVDNRRGSKCVKACTEGVTTGKMVMTLGINH